MQASQRPQRDRQFPPPCTGQQIASIRRTSKLFSRSQGTSHGHLLPTGSVENVSKIIKYNGRQIKLNTSGGSPVHRSEKMAEPATHRYKHILPRTALTNCTHRHRLVALLPLSLRKVSQHVCVSGFGMGQSASPRVCVCVPECSS